MAWISDEPMIYDKLTPREYLEFVAGLWGVESALAEMRAQELLDRLDLAAHADERCEGFPRACARRWRSPARWCTSRKSSFSTSR
jgi:ABC-2 type transport system ATP-binding protein